MYLTEFNLYQKPFEYLIPSPDFLYYAPQYRIIKTKSDYVVTERGGHLHLTGPVGSGKTSMLKSILQILNEIPGTNINYINVPPPSKPGRIETTGLTPNGLVRRICEGYEEIKTARGYDVNLNKFTDWLNDQAATGKFPVLVLDEAQYLSDAALKTLHYLMTYVNTKKILLMIILCGQEELAGRIATMKEVESRMLPASLSFLTLEETKSMIEYRWAVASTAPDIVKKLMDEERNNALKEGFEVHWNENVR